MTIREALLSAWELSGRRSDLEPFDDTAVNYDETEIVDGLFGTDYWLRQFTQAERVITSWMKRGVRPLRFDDLIDEVLVKVQPYDIANFDRVTLTADVNSSLVARDYTNNVIYFDGLYTVIGTVNSFFLDRFSVPNFGLGDVSSLVNQSVLIDDVSYTISAAVINGGNYDITLNGEIAGVALSESIDVTFNFGAFSNFIMSTTDDGTDSTFILKDAIGDTYPESFDVKLYMNNFRIDLLNLGSTFRHILKVVNIDTASKIKKGKRKESFYLDATNSQGSPEYWEQRGGRIYFDTSINEELNLKFEILTVPPTLTSVDDEFFVRDVWHIAIISYASWRTAERSQEFDKAYALKRDFQELMASITPERASDFYRDDTYGVYRLTEEEEI